tara:strand:+ start:9387 stop:10094 length:708 start_codon:yes stop_codon:yes gene_type:complete
MELFYSNNIKNDIIFLDNVESRHCIKVLRKTIGDEVNIVDGFGSFYKGIICIDDIKECQIKVLSKIEDYDRKNNYIHIAISPIKNNNRIEWFVEKAVEIGVDEISFIDCERTLRHNVKMERILKTAVSAMKQTLKASLPMINDICDFDHFINHNKNSNKFICHLEDDLKSNIFEFEEQIISNSNSCILIGPEGDFTIDEINKAKALGFKSITLGRSRLRTETAGIIACHLLNIIN